MPKSKLCWGFVLLVVSLVGCQKTTGQATGTESSSPLKLAFISNNPFEFWTIAERGTDKAKAELGVEVTFRRPARGSAAEQKQIIEDLLAKGVKGIAISPNDAASFAPYLNQVAEKALLVTVDSDVPPGHKRLCYLGTNNFEAGRSAGELLKQALPEGGKFAILVGVLDVQNAVERRAGVIAALAGVQTQAEAEALAKQEPAKLGKWELLVTRTDQRSAANCKANAEDLLVKHPELKGMVGLWAYNPPSILAALKDKQLQGKVAVVGFDEDEPTLQGVREGHVVGTIVQQPFEFGYQSMKLLAALAKGDRSGLPAGGILHIPHKAITKENVEAFSAELAKLKGK